MKRKGTRAERELFHKFWETNKWSVVRSAGSGSTPLPNPDLIASNSSRILAIECKASKSKYQYFEKLEIEQLKQYAELSNAEAWVAVKFDRTPWYFVKIEDLKETGNRFSVDLEFIKQKGYDLFLTKDLSFIYSIIFVFFFFCYSENLTL